MPKLSAKAAKRVDQAEVSDFSAIPAGTYIGSLVDVDGSREGSKGPYWSWEFDVVGDTDGDDTYAGRKLWVNTSLSEKADFKMKEVFQAFGYTVDSDTDEIVGERCKLVVSQRVIETGLRKGQMGNNVDQCLPLGASEGGAEEEEEEEVF
jgi:hypothetical protein